MTEAKRGIKSFVLRQGRLTPGQSKALDSGWPRYGLSLLDGVADFRSVFGNNNPVWLEIGFGMGDSLAEQASADANVNFVGVEVHRPGVGHLLIQVESLSLNNVRVFSEDSIDVLITAIADHSLDRVQVFFPDPWHKKRHNKRRLINQAFLLLLKQKLTANGLVHVATDWLPYAQEVQDLFAADADFEQVSAPVRPETKFERRGVRLGHTITDLAYRLVSQQ